MSRPIEIERGGDDAQPWPAMHGSVPLVQSQPKGMYFQWPV